MVLKCAEGPVHTTDGIASGCVREAPIERPIDKEGAEEADAAVGVWEKRRGHANSCRLTPHTPTRERALDLWRRKLAMCVQIGRPHHSKCAFTRT